MDNLTSLFGEPTADQVRRHAADLATALAHLRAPWHTVPSDPFLFALESNRKAAVEVLQAGEAICRAYLDGLAPVAADPFIHEPCDNPACQLPGCRDERDALDRLGQLDAERHAASHPKADPYPNEREMIRAGEGY